MRRVTRRDDSHASALSLSLSKPDALDAAAHDATHAATHPGTDDATPSPAPALQRHRRADMDEFLPRMFNCANPWELQDFCENFFFTAGAGARFSLSLCSQLTRTDFIAGEGAAAAGEGKVGWAAVCRALLVLAKCLCALEFILLYFTLLYFILL